MVEPATLAEAFPVTCISSFQRWVDTLKPYQSAPSDLWRPILADYIRALIAQNVVYAEIMISSTMFPREWSAMLTGLHRWREWANELEEGKIQIEFLFVLPRTLPQDLLERDTRTFIELRREGLIVGVALVGPENGQSIERFRETFMRFRDVGLGVEVHAGEHSGPESVWDALKNGFPDRLGHAVSAFHDSSLIEHIRSKRIHLEFCPTSNLRTGAVMNMSEHPIGLARRLGLSFSINTDDPGAFGCSMNSEFQAIKDVFGFTEEDFMNVFAGSLAARFEPRLKYLRSEQCHSTVHAAVVGRGAAI